MRVGGGLATAAAALVLVAAPAALAQRDPGGRAMSFTLNQSFESQRNPELEADRENESRQISNTDLNYRISSTTRRASLRLDLGVRLRGAAGDLDIGEEEGFEFDRPRAALRHRYTAPGASIRTDASVQRFNIGFLQPLELIQNEDGTVEVPDDIEDLEGTGFRTNARLNVTARFGEDRPFGWGFSVRNSVLTYQDIGEANLEDRTSTTTGLNARFDLTPVLTLTTGLRYGLRQSGDDDATSTVNYDLVLERERGPNGVLRAGLSFASPEDRDDRFTVFIGGTQEIDERRSLDFNLGTTTGESGEARIVALVNYEEAVTPTFSVSAGINRQAEDTADNETVLDTAARLDLNKVLTPLSRVSFGVRYAARENFTRDTTTERSSVTAQYSRALTEDWAVSVGASYIWRDETGEDETTSDRVFINLGRSWSGRF